MDRTFMMGKNAGISTKQVRIDDEINDNSDNDQDDDGVGNDDDDDNDDGQERWNIF